MARIRTVKPDFWKHEDLSELPADTHMLAAALLNYADDEGYFNANPKLIQAECCPLRELSVSVPDSLIRLADIGYLDFGTGADGKRYGRIVKFSDHQRVNRLTPSKIKVLNIAWSDHAQISEPSPPEGKGREQGKEGIYSVSKETGDEPPETGEDRHEDPLAIPLAVVVVARDDPRKALFNHGISYLSKTTGKREGQFRSLVGRWLRDTDDDARWLYDKLAEAQRDNVADPVSWIQANIKGRIGHEGIVVEQNPTNFDDERWHGCMAVFQDSGEWPDHWGPKPGDPDCLVPKDIQGPEAAP